MSFFRRDSEEPPGFGASSRPASSSPAPGARERAVTRIAEGTRLQGEITGATEVLVEGEVLGQIRLESRVVVGAAGVVRGRVSARSVLVAGAVEGDVRGSERVEVGASGRLQGDISAPRVTIAEGAFFKGKVEMTGGPPERASEAAPPPPEAPGLFPDRRPPGPGEPPKGPAGGGGGEGS